MTFSFLKYIILVNCETVNENRNFFTKSFKNFLLRASEKTEQHLQSFCNLQVLLCNRYLLFSATSSKASAKKASTDLVTVSPARLRTETVPSSVSFAPMTSI